MHGCLLNEHWEKTTPMLAGSSIYLQSSQKITRILIIAVICAGKCAELRARLAWVGGMNQSVYCVQLFVHGFGSGVGFGGRAYIYSRHEYGCACCAVYRRAAAAIQGVLHSASARTQTVLLRDEL
jgi:hypothetical protein